MRRTIDSSALTPDPKIMRNIFNKTTVRLAAVSVCICMLCGALSSCARTTTIQPKVTTDSGETVTTSGVEEPNTDFRICIDPGHGFGDAGFTSPYIDGDEKGITLAFAMSLRDELEERGYEVILTHDGDSFPETARDNGDDVFSPEERAAFVAEAQSDCFISVHCNTYVGDDSENVDGVRLYYCPDVTSDADSVISACDLMCEHIGAAFPGLSEPRVIAVPASDSYPVLRLVDTCALVLNLGFMSNRRDASNMTDEVWMERMAASVADAIDAYFVFG